MAPHLVRPRQLVVPAFDGARPDLMTAIGLNMYDVMAAPSLRARRSARRGADGAQDDWSPARHRLISGAGVTELLPALTARNPSGGYLFYDCQTDDARLVLTVLGEAERFGAVCANRIAPSRRTHITLRHEDLPLNAGAIVPAGGGRSIFALPWVGRSLIGTTDNNYDGDIGHVQPAAQDIDYLPLVERDGHQAPCRTQEIPLVAPVATSDLPEVEVVDRDAYPQLASRYGHAAHRVLATAESRGELAQPIVDGLPDLLAEAAFSVRPEQARTVGDVLLRRTRLGLIAACELGAPDSVIPLRVAAAMAPECGWDAVRITREAQAFGAEAAAEGLIGAGRVAAGP
ncbi:MAG: hypothetical protein M3022_16930 [Actinomycetota bacterium]|nr:hypothetical protein [Actinomycetota bacterium]